MVFTVLWRLRYLLNFVQWIKKMLCKQQIIYAALSSRRLERKDTNSIHFMNACRDVIASGTELFTSVEPKKAAFLY